MDRESMKHTQGPWVVDPAVRQGFTVYAPKEGFIVGTQDEEGRYGAIESEANARLIAAAPDLLHAIDLCLDAMLHDGVPTDPEHPARVALTAARNASFKATGQKV